MRRRLEFAFVGLLLASVAHAADATGCAVRKGLYDSWLSTVRHEQHILPKIGALVASSKSTPDPSLAQNIRNEYGEYYQCISEAILRVDEDGGRRLCREAAADRLAALVCQVALYIKTGRTGGKELLDALPTSRKGAELIWDLDAIANGGADRNQFPEIFLPKGPAYKIVDELFVLVLDDRDTAFAKYFHIADAATGGGARYVDSQIKILLRESPAVVVKQWEILRRYQPRVRKLLTELEAELSITDMKKLRQGIAGFCAKDNLDCPEILKVFGRPE